MGFLVTTSIFCDQCHNSDERASRGSDTTICKWSVWAAAKLLGWKKISGKHVCSECRLKEIEVQLSHCSGSGSALTAYRRRKISALEKEAESIRYAIESSC